MGIYTATKIHNDHFGVNVRTDDKKIKFRPLGKLPALEEVLECIEDDKVYIKLSSSFGGRRKVAYVLHGDLLDPQTCRELADLGFDVTRALAGHFVDAIRLQIEGWEATGTAPTAAYTALGWMQVPYRSAHVQALLPLL